MVAVLWLLSLLSLALNRLMLTGLCLCWYTVHGVGPARGGGELNDTDRLGELLVDEVNEKGDEAFTDKEENVAEPKKESSAAAGGVSLTECLATSKSSFNKYKALLFSF